MLESLALLRTLIGSSFHRRHHGGKGHHRRRSGSHRKSSEYEREPASLLVRREIRLPRFLLGISLVIAPGWLAWDVVAGTAALNLAHRNPERALRFNATESAALDRRARQEVLDPGGNLAAAKAWARQALRSRPIDDQALFLLGYIAQKGGNDNNAATLMRIAGARTWRNSGAQLWLFKRDVRRGEYTSALTHADAMLRVVPDFEKKLFPAIAAFTLTAPSNQAWAGFLASGPGWRERFLR
ncbi:MAG: hypothetical protein P8Y71_25385 [Pseudolabrys sp.]